MNRKIKLVSMVSLLSLVVGTSNAAVVNKVDCEALGYTTPLNDCLAANGTPLFCPFHSVEKPMTLCLTKSCRGYPLTEEDLESKASDGRGVREHIAELDSCTTSPVEGGKTYYKVVRCKDTSLYQNNLCDVGCLAERYPYDSHQGNIAGDMRRCDDSTGEHYGYETCNDGWQGGWAYNRTGKCLLNNCSVQDYPFAKDPNTPEDDRGALSSCRVGGNQYYRYTQKDNNGNALTENACGVSNSYHLSGAVCYKECQFNNCSYTTKNESLSGYAFSYKEWSCKQVTPNCRVGDEAIVNGTNVGVITHLPDDDTNKVNIISMTTLSGTYAAGEFGLDDVPLPNLAGSPMITDKNGKYNTAFMIAYKNKQNETAPSPYSFPIFEKIAVFAPEGCSGVCGVGEWYFYAGGELYEMFQNRYILYNKTRDTTGSRFTSSWLASSTDFYGPYVTMIYFTGTSGTGSPFSDVNKVNSTITAHPMISFTLK